MLISSNRAPARLRLTLPAIVFLAFGIPLFSTVLQQLSIERMTAVSTEIVQGTVTGSYVALSGNTIFTHYTVEVSSRLKGPDNPATDVAIPGGSLHGLRQAFPGVPVLRQGAQYMLFLWKGARGPNQPVGLNQGVLEVGANADGEMMASRRPLGETLLSAAGKPVLDHAVRMRVAEMHARIRAVLAAAGTGAGGAAK